MTAGDKGMWGTWENAGLAGQTQTLLVVPEPEPGEKVLTKLDTHSKSTGQ